MSVTAIENDMLYIYINIYWTRLNAGLYRLKRLKIQKNHPWYDSYSFTSLWNSDHFQFLKWNTSLRAPRCERNKSAIPKVIRKFILVIRWRHFWYLITTRPKSSNRLSNGTSSRYKSIIFPIWTANSRIRSLFDNNYRVLEYYHSIEYFIGNFQEWNMKTLSSIIQTNKYLEHIFEIQFNWKTE